MHLAIFLTGKSYSPESHAYENFLKSKDWNVSLVQPGDTEINADINLYFLGYRPFLKKKNYSIPILHEYQSVSTPPCVTLKNFFKSNLSEKPSGRIFLNEFVSSSFNFHDNKPYIFRDMGVDKIFYQSIKYNHKFDIVYCGSIEGRNGLIEELLRISAIGFRIIVIGRVSSEVVRLFDDFKNIEFTGILNKTQISEIYKISKCGLNYMPNIYPYNVQTSTKLIEYCAAGLNIISSNYCWINQFQYASGGRFLDLSKLISFDDIYTYDFFTPCVDHLEWSSLLSRINFDKFILDFC